MKNKGVDSMDTENNIRDVLISEIKDNETLDLKLNEIYNRILEKDEDGKDYIDKLIDSGYYNGWESKLFYNYEIDELEVHFLTDKSIPCGKTVYTGLSIDFTYKDNICSYECEEYTDNCTKKDECLKDALYEDYIEFQDDIISNIFEGIEIRGFD